MKSKRSIPASEKDAPKNVTVLELNLDEDISILCTPTGEQWRIAAVDAENISFEKLD